MPIRKGTALASRFVGQLWSVSILNEETRLEGQRLPTTMRNREGGKSHKSVLLKPGAVAEHRSL